MIFNFRSTCADLIHHTYFLFTIIIIIMVIGFVVVIIAWKLYSTSFIDLAKEVTESQELSKTGTYLKFYNTRVI